MSSSSDNEGAVVPVKRIRRRRLVPVDGPGHESAKVNLYSRKILPKLNAIATSPMKLDMDEDSNYAPFSVLSKETSPITVACDESPEPKGDQGPCIMISPVEDIPPTPPPAFVPKSRRGRGSYKAKKLLSEVSSVLTKVSNLDASSDSIIVEEVVEQIKEILVKIRIRGRLHKFPIAESDTFGDMFEKLARKEKVEKARLLITLGDKRIFPSDTPLGVQLTIADILECVIARRRLAPHVTDIIEIQMQGQFERRKVPYTMGKDEPLREIMQEYASKNSTDLKHLTFLFDGENLDPESTPKSLDLDNGDCIDVVLRT